MQTLFRFAPSPNGDLHLGHAYSALFNARLAAQTGGVMLLRIEDIDQGRSQPEFELAIVEDLAWLGLDWPEPVRRQSTHFSDYALALERLQGMGLVYPCFCTRGEIAAASALQNDARRDPDGAPLYPGTCKHMSALERARRLNSGQNAALRLDVDLALARCGALLGWSEYGEGAEPRDVRAEPMVWGDAVLGRKDVPASYHIAVVIDDALQGVSDVARGRDLYAATNLHRLLQALLGLPAPRYHHHRLIKDAEGLKLSKSRGSPTLRDLRADGVSADEVRYCSGAG